MTTTPKHHSPIVVEIIFFLVVDLKSYGTLTLRGFKNQKMCNLWKSYTILRFFQLIITLSTDEHVHLQTKYFKIDYKFMAFCTFLKILVQCVWLYPVTHQILPLYKATIEEISAEIFSVVLKQKKVYVYLHRPPPPCKIWCHV